MIDLGWMAWTWPTAGFFAFIFACLMVMGVIHCVKPSQPRPGILGLTTTRGDRLFLSLVGSAYVLLGWLGLIGTPLWGALGLMGIWSAFVFWKV